MQTAPALSSTFRNEITALTEKLSPAGADEVAKCINALLDRGFMVPSSVSDEFTLDLYRDALSATPIEGLRKAFVKLKQGDYPEYVDFLPKPAALASLANAEAKHLRADRARMSERARLVRENAALGIKTGKHKLLKNVAEDARMRAEELSLSGWNLLEYCASQEAWVGRVKKGLPVGAIFLWAIGEIWAPPSAIDAGRVAA
jgi:hypothetical protein